MTVKKNLPLPKIPNQQVYYKRQFAIVVGNVHSSLAKENVFLYTWKESDAQKGSNETASAIFHRLQKLDLQKIKLCWDWWSKQKHYYNLVSLRLDERTRTYISKTVTLAYLRIKFLLILRRKDTIISLEEYIKIFQESGSVLELGVDWCAFNWKAACSQNIKSMHFKIDSRYPRTLQTLTWNFQRDM